PPAARRPDYRPAAGGPAGQRPALHEPALHEPALREAALREETLPAGALMVPVLGVSRTDLRDTFLEARGVGRTHRAMDILAPTGTPVIASVDGTIRKLFVSKAGGLTIYQFDREEEHVYYYAHLDRYADGLAEGNFVPRGSVIGYVGTSGNTRGTPHLHFSIEVLPPTKEWWKGDPVNPFPLLTR
ncbi:MAG: M23 family metallopeptidase, partial [Thermoanaerobaculia bacterium]